jgi:hypothetical protein
MRQGFLVGEVIFFVFAFMVVSKPTRDHKRRHQRRFNILRKAKDEALGLACQGFVFNPIMMDLLPRKSIVIRREMLRIRSPRSRFTQIPTQNLRFSVGSSLTVGTVVVMRDIYEPE